MNFLKHQAAERDRARQQNEMFETALAAIWAVLNANGVAGWEDWSRYAAAGEWPC